MVSKKGEKRILRKFLDILENTKYRLDGELSVEERESPDFVLAVGPQRIGVEVTLAVPEELARAQQAVPEQGRVITHLKDTSKNERRSTQRSQLQKHFG